MDHARGHLEAVEHLIALAAELRVEVWLSGGRVMHFFLGEVIRRHNDIDWCALANGEPRLGDALVQEGFQDTGTFLGVHARIISPAAHIEIKRMMPT